MSQTWHILHRLEIERLKNKGPLLPTEVALHHMWQRSRPFMSQPEFVTARHPLNASTAAHRQISV